jgi:hypothetical protein
VLGGAVGTHARRAREAGRRTHIDDRAASRQRGELGAQAEEDAAQVDRQHPVEVGRIDVGERDRPMTLPGVVERAVDASVAITGHRHQALDGATVRDVGGDGVCLPILPPDLGGDPFECVLVASGEHDRRSLRGEELRRRGADAATRAGDDQDLAVEVAHFADGINR